MRFGAGFLSQRPFEQGFGFFDLPKPDVGCSQCVGCFNIVWVERWLSMLRWQMISASQRDA
jgi:hypothetical protein